MRRQLKDWKWAKNCYEIRARLLSTCRRIPRWTWQNGMQAVWCWLISGQVSRSQSHWKSVGCRVDKMEPATKVVMLIEVCNHNFTLIFLVSKVSTQILREPYIVHPFWGLMQQVLEPLNSLRRNKTPWIVSLLVKPDLTKQILVYGGQELLGLFSHRFTMKSVSHLGLLRFAMARDLFVKQTLRIVSFPGTVDGRNPKQPPGMYKTL